MFDRMQARPMSGWRLAAEPDDAMAMLLANYPPVGTRIDPTGG